MASRILAWFSCGAASTVAAKLACDKYGWDCQPVYCDTSASEHPDNKRFMSDVELWLRTPIKIIKSAQYDSVDEVFEQTRYMSGVGGARCTVEMKKIPRFNFQRPDDIHVFGYTSEETKRIAEFEANNPELKLEWPLRDRGFSKADCFAILKYHSIELPMMYRQGYRNNNCIGCVKATSVKYWNSVRRDYPAIFQRRAKQSRDIGCRLTRFKGKRIFLDELPPDIFTGKDENISCGPECTPLDIAKRDC